MNYYNYFTEIEETFVRRRGKNLVLSPLDWALMEVWREKEVPLHIVLRAIESVFDIWEKQPKQHRTVKSLAYCREEIEAQFEEWLDTRVGASDDAEQSPADEDPLSNKAVAAHLSDSLETIRELRDASGNPAMKETLERVCERLGELVIEPEGAERLEQSLDILDEMIDRQLQADETADAVRSEVEKLLSPNRKSMPKDAYDRTFELMLRKKLRDAAGIPRLSLFYL